MASDFESLLAKTSEASEQIGKMEAILPLHEIIYESKGEPLRVYLSMSALLDGFTEWQAHNHAPIGISNHTRYLREGVKAEIERLCHPQ